MIVLSNSVSDIVFVILAIIFAIICIAYIYFYIGIVFVNKNYNSIIERNGKYHKTIKAGWSLIVPFVDKVVATINLGDRKFSNKVNCFIKSDNTSFQFDYSLIYHVVNAENYHYSTRDLEGLVKDFSSSVMLKESQLLKGSIDSFDGERIINEINKECEKYGVVFTSFLLISIKKL